ncbi:MAG: glycosyltransferase family 8 protein [Phascolarctobacterium sp.]|uniref:glycosyltransferase family 8 protein n=1 Tax=Phascolarctobacterium sp. TaxID=2049039 RepID=UPI0026DD7B2E|nr:glycosyltransferase family 8 protein [Phascolarctobacterium sp.]MDO4920621.1 glycosyltransferase family 8 protein [Phascolarctobacterium sp.]
MFNQEDFAKNKFILKTIEISALMPHRNALLSMQPMQPMHIAFNIDDNFFMQAGVAITSILENNKRKPFFFHIFCDGVSDANLAKMRRTAEKYGTQMRIYIMDMQPFQSFHIKTKHFSRVTYLRSVMPKILQPLTDKYLYMDADMICVGDISEIEKIDLQDYPFAAASETPEAVKYKTEFLHQKSGKHFNDGLMWIDINEWEKERITEKVFSYQGADPSRFSGQSQDIMNLVLDGEILFIDRKFNGGSDKGVLIYHFTGRNKPWQMVIGEGARLWRHYLDVSCWDSIKDPNPPKDPAHYFNHKLMMQHYKREGQYGEMLKSCFWYSWLKIRYKLGI